MPRCLCEREGRAEELLEPRDHGAPVPASVWRDALNERLSMGSGEES